MSHETSNFDLADNHCPACYGAAESYFANGYTCPTCGRKESLFLKAIQKDRTITNEGLNRIGDTIADLRTENERLRKIEAAAIACAEYEQWTGSTFYDLMITLQDALRQG